jgi:NAD(P)-dependent dehydrogenase (short-subunit alcohol dehydrogenase family)
LASAIRKSCTLIEMTLKDKVVVVTGSGGFGSGRAIASRFAREGSFVCVSDINQEGGLETVREIEQHGGQAVFCHTDVRVEEQVHALIAFAESRYGAVSVLVNNASASYRPSEPLEHWAEIVQTDLLGAMYGTRFAVDSMRRAGGGAITNVSSTSALGHGRPTPGGSPAYDVAKAGVLRLTTTLVRLASEGIRVNCIAPDWIPTPELRAYIDSLSPEQRLRSGVPSRLTTLDEISTVVLELATDESLAGRVLVWWSDDAPRLIPWGDPGYASLS